MMRNSFEQLHDEIKVIVLHFCSLQAIFRFALTCKKNYHLVDNSATLQLQIELEVNGLEIIKKTSNDSTYRQILSELRRYRDAWFDVDLLPLVGIPQVAQGPGELRWQLYEGHWAWGFSAAEDKPDSLRAINLDSPTIPLTVNFGVTYDQFAVDASQQLVVLLAASRVKSYIFQIHLRSLVTGKPHPMARLPILTATLFEHNPMWVDLSCQISRVRFGPQIMGETLITNVGSSEDWSFCVLVWDWTVGVLLGHFSSTKGFCDIAFLDQYYLVSYEVLRGPDGDDELISEEHYDDENWNGAKATDKTWEVSLKIYSIPRAHPSYHVVSHGQFDAIDSNPLLPIVCFTFPDLNDIFSIIPHKTLLRSGPTPGYGTYTSTSAQFAHSKLFTLGLTLTLSQQDFTYSASEDMGFADLSYRIFVNTGHLLKHLPAEGNGQKSVPWDEWGEQATRWFLEDPTVFNYRECWVGWVSGSRFVKSDFLNESGDAQALSIFDFNPLIVERHLHRSRSHFDHVYEDEGETNAAVSQEEGLFAPTYLYGGHIDKTPSVHLSRGGFVVSVRKNHPTCIYEGFKEPVWSHLPYMSVTKADSVFSSGGWFIDGNRIISIQERINAPWEFHVYRLDTRDDAVVISDNQ